MYNGNCCMVRVKATILSKSCSVIWPRRMVEEGISFCSAMIPLASCSAAICTDPGKLRHPAHVCLDLVLRRELDRRVIVDVDHVVADADQVPPDGEIVDRATVVFGIDDRGRLGGQPREILAHRQAGDIEIGRQKSLQGDRSRRLSDPDEICGDLENLLMHGLEEM